MASHSDNSVPTLHCAGCGSVYIISEKPSTNMSELSARESPRLKTRPPKITLTSVLRKSCFVQTFSESSSLKKEVKQRRQYQNMYVPSCCYPIAG